MRGRHRPAGRTDEWSSGLRRWLVAAAAAALVLGTAACAAETPPVLAPKGPGESNSTASQERVDSASKDGERTKADTAYVRMMIEHHRQALVMTDLVPDRAHRGDIKTIADRIAVAQDSEIEAMEDWLREDPQNPCAPDDEDGEGGDSGEDAGAGHDHGGGHDRGGTEGTCPPVDHDDMAGMATDAQLDDLKDADGKDFDALFVKLMTTHHKGAITMAEDVLDKGSDPVVLQMANDVISEQRAEIRRMAEILKD